MKGARIIPSGGRKPSSYAGLGPPMEQAIAHPLAVPPDDLTVEEQIAWRTLAPAAISQATLVPATVAGFRELVELFVVKECVAAALFVEGVASADLKPYLNVAQRLEGMLARFRLAPSGRPEPSALVQTAANPWARVAS